MSSTCMVIPMQIPSQICRLLAIVALMTLPSAWASTASAAVAWHADIATARRASEVSQRPVLAIFTASWSSASTTLDRTTLASDEAVALITACFEPVCVDVDESPEATRRLGITKVPTACILSADDQVLSKFELPETPADFVAAAARAAQEAAFASAAASRSQAHASATETTAGARTFADGSRGGSGSFAGFGSDAGTIRQTAPRAEVWGTVPPGGPALNAVAAKVRRLSDFASTDASSTVITNPAIAESFRDTAVDQFSASPAVMPRQAESSQTVSAPATEMATAAPPAVTAPADTTPPTGPATVAFVNPTETTATSASLTAPAGFAAGGQATQSPLAIEPSPTAPSNATAGSAPWLGAQQQTQSISTPATAQAAATAAIPPAASAPRPAGEPQPSTTEQATAGAAATPLAETKPEKPATATSSLLAALQKPFSLFTTKPMFAKSTPKSTTQAASATPETTTPETTTAAATPAEPDTFGSMPVGLEGYCPVTLAERGAWVEGRAQWGVRHRGRTYLFASVDQQKAFLADPDRYAPALSGDDPVLAFDAGKSTPGQRRYGVTYQSRTYLFTSPETRDAFAANPQRYTSGAMVAENRGPSNGPVVR